MSFNAEFFLEALIALGSGFGPYAAIRADLARLSQKATQAAVSASHAHRRIDDHLQIHK